MAIHVRLFALLRERKGTDSVEIEARPGETAGSLFERIFPDLADDPIGEALAFALNATYIERDHPVSDGDEVAFIPPLGGGSGDPRVLLSPAPLLLDPLVDRVTDPSRGGLATFTGLVRDRFEGRKVTGLDYESYEAMALKEMSRLCDEIEERWPGVAVAMAHRVGGLRVGEAAVHVVVAAPHRAAAFEACRYGIDELKERVPIFKKECYEDGSVWKENIRG